MRVLVCGGRDFGDYELLKTILSALQVSEGFFDVLIHGGATGADTLADQYARRHLIPVLRFLPDWETYGKAAGPRRNEAMLRDGRPDLVVAFKGGRGTADMIKRARAAGIEVREIAP